jgi:5-methylcytosine-specific restriction endonuclease McrA
VTEVVARSLPNIENRGLFAGSALHGAVAEKTLTGWDYPARKEPTVYNLMTLVLNADYQPLSTWPLSLIRAQEAITDYYKERVQVVETWKDAFGEDRLFRSPSMSIPAPKVVVLNEYATVVADAKFSRRSILLRDRFTCQYCGKQFPSNDLTFDHLIPREKGGKTTWENIVTACSPCNARKANKLPDFSGKKGSRGTGLRPLKMPVRPSNTELLKVGLDYLPNQIKEDFGSWLYWNIELEP